MLMTAEYIGGARLLRRAGHRYIEVAFKHKPGKWSSVVSHCNLNSLVLSNEIFSSTYSGIRHGI